MALQSDKASFVAARKSSKSVDRTKQSDATDKDKKIRSKTSPTKAAARSRKERNFILENKLKVKRISSANKAQDDDNNSNDTSRNVRVIIIIIIQRREINSLIFSIRERNS